MASKKNKTKVFKSKKSPKFLPLADEASITAVSVDRR